MVVTRKASNPAPVPSRTNTSQNRPPQLRDNALAHDILDPFARRNGPIPPQFADNVQYAKPTKSTTTAQPAASAPASPSKPKQKPKKKPGQKTVPLQLVHARPRTSVPKRRTRWSIEAWVLLLFTVYIFTVCPTDTQHEHSVCNTIDQYQSYIPYKYIRYQLDNALEHPYVAPVIHQTAPYYHSAVRTTKPYVVGAKKQWNAQIAPSVSRVLLRAERWATPYALSAAEGFHVRVDPHLYRLQKALRPYRRQAERLTLVTMRRMYLGWRATEPRLQDAWAVLKTVPPKVLEPLAGAWQTWGDPQVRRLWARMQEVAAGKGKTGKTQPRRSPQATFGAFAQPVDEADDYDEEDEDGTDAAPAAAPAASASKPPPATAEEPADDVASFLNDLLDNDDDAPASPAPPAAPEQPAQAESEEELARKRHAANVEKAKDKRAVFEQNFQAALDKLEATAKEQTDAFIHELEAERKTILAAFQSADSRVMQDMKALEDELTLGLKSMSTYLETLHKDVQEQQRPQLWQRLVDKLKSKVDARIHNTEEVVQELWEGVQKLEQGIIERAHTPVYHVSEDAQAKLGMPLAWLEDVTPADWKRFHEMKERVKAVRQTFVEIQEGDHPRSPADPIIAFFKRTQADMQDVLAGFEVQFNEIRRKGEASFQQPNTGKAAPEETIVPFIGRDPDEIKVALRHEEL